MITLTQYQWLKLIKHCIEKIQWHWKKILPKYNSGIVWYRYSELCLRLALCFSGFRHDYQVIY